MKSYQGLALASLLALSAAGGLAFAQDLNSAAAHAGKKHHNAQLGEATLQPASLKMTASEQASLDRMFKFYSRADDCDKVCTGAANP